MNFFKYKFIKCCRYCSEIWITTSDNENPYSILPSHHPHNPALAATLQPPDATEARRAVPVLPHQHPGGQAGVRAADDGQVHTGPQAVARLQQEGAGQCHGHRHQTREPQPDSAAVAHTHRQGEPAQA